MQLRVARLCLNCEEVYAGESCPVCASDQYAFLTSWLPVEERRKWRGRGPKTQRTETSALKRFLQRWFGDPEEQQAPPADVQARTRASDTMPRLDFEEPIREPRRPVAHTRPVDQTRT